MVVVYSVYIYLLYMYSFVLYYISLFAGAYCVILGDCAICEREYPIRSPAGVFIIWHTSQVDDDV